MYATGDHQFGRFFVLRRFHGYNVRRPHPDGGVRGKHRAFGELGTGGIDG
jgi:hypothetical protein